MRPHSRGAEGASGVRQRGSRAGTTTARHARARHRTSTWKRAVAGAVALVTAGTGVAASTALPAAAATDYELEGSWAQTTPASVETGDAVSPTWWFNLN